ncbi:MAG: hypothetical protein U0939_18860 [Pirellulales bacterium]
MTIRWAAVVPHARRSSVLPLLSRPGVETLDAPDGLWVRGDATDEEELRRLIPGEPVFRLDEALRLWPLGGRVPQGRSPAGDWRPLRSLFQLELPLAAQGSHDTLAALPRAVPLRLVRSGAERPAELLIVESGAWYEYAETAPQWRLERLAMAARRDGRVALWGVPLPPLPGRRYWLHDGLATPCGWHWDPPFSTRVLRSRLSLAADELALVESSGCEVIPAQAWVRATRSAVRATRETLRHDAET